MNRSALKIEPIKAFADNYMWVISLDKHCVIVDPGDGKKALTWIRESKLQLDGILLTHEHNDHNAGVLDLVVAFPEAKVIDPNFAASQVIKFLGREFKVIATPGHSDVDVSYLLGDKHLFSGDILFRGGCGRVFTGNFAKMFTSIEKLAALPDGVVLYPGHEYTLANLKFARHILPKDPVLIDAEEYFARNGVSEPTSLMMEQQINLFLRCHEFELQEALDCVGDSFETFKKLRKLKDNFSE